MFISLHFKINAMPILVLTTMCGIFIVLIPNPIVFHIARPQILKSPGFMPGTGAQLVAYSLCKSLSVILRNLPDIVAKLYCIM